MARRSVGRPLRALLAALVALVGLTGWLASDAAAAGPLWSKPVMLFETTGDTNNPALVADPSGDVHLFFWYSESHEADAAMSGVIMYARLHNGVWSKPVDIQAPANGASKETAVLDDLGYLHLVWLDTTAHSLYYSRAHVSDASSARAWTKPVQLSTGKVSDGAFAVPESIAISSGRTLHVVYTSDTKVSYLHSQDGGDTWSSPSVVGDAAQRHTAVDDPRIVGDSSGRVFAAWTEYAQPAGWPPTATYYARSTDGGSTWSRAMRVSGQDHALLTLASDGNTIFRTWNARGELGEHTGQWSSDGGATWSDAAPLWPGAASGLSGFTAMAFDSLGQLHVAFNGGDSMRGATASADGQTWSVPQVISQGSIGKSSIEEPTVAVSLGNQVNVAWEDDFARIWYTSQLTDAPGIPARSVPAPVPTAKPVADTPVRVPAEQSVARATTTPGPSAATPRDDEAVSIVQTNSVPLAPLIGGGLISLLLLAAVATHWLRRLS